MWLVFANSGKGAFTGLFCMGALVCTFWVAASDIP